MKFFYHLIIAILISSCSVDKYSDPKKETNHANQIVKSELQSIIDSSEVVGSVLIYDFQKDIYYSNNFDWANKGFLPAVYKLLIF